MNTRSVTRFSFYIYLAAAHGVTRRVARQTVNDDFSVVHSVANLILHVAENGYLAAAHKRGESVTRNAFYHNAFVFRSRADKSLPRAVDEFNFVLFANKRIKFGKAEVFTIYCFHYFLR